MTIAIVGLGKMGAQLARMLTQADHHVIAVDPDPAAVAAAGQFGAVAASDRADAVSKFGDEPAIVWLMIPAHFVSDEVAAWLEVLPADSILIDGGNTDFRQTKQHAAAAANEGVKFIDIGVSGGILGLKNGFSMMAAGDESAYRLITPILDTLAGTRGGHDYFGEPGAGHYVKMVHNAIEYGMMESLAEGYRMLHEGAYDGLDLARAGAVWQKASVIESTLNGLAAEIMQRDPTLPDADGYVAESGEGRWTLEVAKEKGVALPAIESAFEVRLRSQQGDVSYTTKLLAELRNKFGGHPLNTNG